MRTALLGGALLLMSVVLGGPGPGARADEPAPGGAAEPKTPVGAASLVLEAVDAGDADTVRRLAALDEPDPWLVADQLCHRGRFDAAEAFAKAAPRPTVAKLPEYVASRREVGVEADREARSALAEVLRARSAGDWRAVCAQTEDLANTPRSIPGILLLYQRGMALFSLLHYPDSAIAFRAAAEAAEALGWLTQGARCLFLSGVGAFRGDLWKDARARFEASLEAYEGLGQAYWVAESRNQLGLAHLYLGDLRTALGHFERALAEFQVLRDRAGVARCLGNLGIVHRSLGDYPRTLELYARSLANYEAVGDTAGIARSFGNRGVVHQRLGDYRAALADFERSMAEFEKKSDRIGIARNLLNIGGTYTQMGDHARALEASRDALALFRELGNREGVLRSLLHCGSALAKLGQQKEALAATSEALALAEELGDRTAIAVALGNLGFVHLEFGDPDAALEELERARETLEARSGSALHVLCLRGLAKVHLLRGELGASVRRAREAALALTGIVAGLGEQQGAGAREVWIEPFEIGAEAALRAGSREDLVYFLESGRAGGLREALGARQALGEALIPSDLRNVEAEARAVEARALVARERAGKGGRRRDVRAAEVALGEARDALQVVVERIQREAKAGADVAYPRAASLAELQGGLDGGDALLLFGAAGETSVVVVMTPDRVAVHELGTVAEIEALVEPLDLTDPDEDPTAALGALQARVVAPLGLGEEITCCLISPHGALSYVPFALLLPACEVAYVPSGTTYRLLMGEAEKRGEQVLALGDPDYAIPFSERAVATVRGGRDLTPLPGTREEARAVGDRVLLGRDATESGLARAAAARERWRAVHLACHGLIDVERPMFSSLALTPDADNDGLLTCLEVFRLRIPADLVVLSACETGRGKIYRAEGIVGLTRAFMFAGAPRVLCSLWQVDDDATRALMTWFYAEWNPKDGTKGIGAAAALQKAQAHVRGQAKWGHPYYWAAWVLWGIPE